MYEPKLEYVPSSKASFLCNHWLEIQFSFEGVKYNCLWNDFYNFNFPFCVYIKYGS